LILSATLDDSPLIQEALLPVQNEQVHSAPFQDIPAPEAEISFSLALEPTSSPSKNNRAKKPIKQPNPKKVKSKESSN